MKRTYAGSCHCGAIRFEVQADIAAGTGKCNCSICAKSRLWSVEARPEELTMIAGEESLSVFTGVNAVAHHPFCSRCGIRPFQRIGMPNMSGHEYFNINIACLAGIDVDELLAAPVEYYDGLHDNWGSRPAEIRHL